jgi:hypothetical protein
MMPTPDEKKMMSECWDCVHLRRNSWTHHIKCAKPDPEMTGSEHGIRNGWFLYPLNFDPVWKTKLCSNLEKGKLS